MAGSPARLGASTVASGLFFTTETASITCATE